MAIKKPNDVFAEIDKYSTVFKLTGLFTLTYSHGEFKRSKRLWLASFFTIWTFQVFNCYNICFDWAKNVTTLYGYMGIAQMLSVIFSGSLMSLVSSFNSDSLNRCLRKMQVVDYQLFSIGEAVPHSRPSKLVMSVIVVIVATFCMRLPTYSTYTRCLLAFFTYYPYILMMMVHLLLDRLFTTLNLRYQAITDVLRKAESLKGKKALVLAEKMVSCYDCLSSSSERLNDFFKFQILSILTSFFIISFSEVYVVIKIFYNSELLVNPKITLINKVSWTVITFLSIWQFGYRFSIITEKAKEFNSLLYRLMIEDKTNIILNNERLRLHFTMKREVVFSACGLFKLDFTLVHSMIAAATTYLVILIQFAQPVSSEVQSSSAAVTVSNNASTIAPTLFSTSYLV